MAATDSVQSASAWGYGLPPTAVPVFGADATQATLEDGVLLLDGGIEFGQNSALWTSGKSTYGDINKGFFLGWDTGPAPDAYKLDIGDITSYLRWTGEEISIKTGNSAVKGIDINADGDNEIILYGDIGTGTVDQYGRIGIDPDTVNPFYVAEFGNIGGATLFGGVRGLAKEGTALAAYIPSTGGGIGLDITVGSGLGVDAHCASAPLCARFQTDNDDGEAVRGVVGGFGDSIGVQGQVQGTSDSIGVYGWNNGGGIGVSGFAGGSFDSAIGVKGRGRVGGQFHLTSNTIGGQLVLFPSSGATPGHNADIGTIWCGVAGRTYVNTTGGNNWKEL